MSRYYFAYHRFNGQIFSTTWVEEDGIAAGGRPLDIVGPIIELSKLEWEKTLSELGRKYPPPELPT